MLGYNTTNLVICQIKIKKSVSNEILTELFLRYFFPALY